MTKMGHDCQKDGCFNIKKRLKFAAFDGCFTGRNQFTDVDALIERGGALCMQEWKGDRCSVGDAQRGALIAFCKQNPQNIAFVVHGDAETMTVFAYAAFHKGGIWMPERKASLTDLRAALKEWFEEMSLLTLRGARSTNGGK